MLKIRNGRDFVGGVTMICAGLLFIGEQSEVTPVASLHSCYSEAKHDVATHLFEASAGWVRYACFDEHLPLTR